VEDAIWKPSKHVEGHMLMGRQDVAQIGTIKDVFERRKDSNPDWRSKFCGNESVTQLVADLYR
jgi:hypothetical protein